MSNQSFVIYYIPKELKLPIGILYYSSNTLVAVTTNNTFRLIKKDPFFDLQEYYSFIHQVNTTVKMFNRLPLKLTTKETLKEIYKNLNSNSNHFSLVKPALSIHFPKCSPRENAEHLFMIYVMDTTPIIETLTPTLLQKTLQFIKSLLKPKT